MITSKPFMTVTHDTNIEYIKNALDSAIKEDIISFYSFVVHSGNDKGKPHIHVFIDPCGDIVVEDVLSVLGAHGYVFTDWIEWSKSFDTEDILTIGIQSMYSHLLEV